MSTRVLERFRSGTGDDVRVKRSVETGVTQTKRETKIPRKPVTSRDTREKKLNEEPIKGIRVVAAEPLRLARRRRVQVSMRHVAAARRGPRGAVQHGPSDGRREQLVAPP